MIFHEIEENKNKWETVENEGNFYSIESSSYININDSVEWEERKIVGFADDDNNDDEDKVNAMMLMILMHVRTD